MQMYIWEHKLGNELKEEEGERVFVERGKWTGQ